MDPKAIVSLASANGQAARTPQGISVVVVVVVTLGFTGIGEVVSSP